MHLYPLPKTVQEFAKLIDHTMLSPDASSAEIERVCKEARDHAFLTVCVGPKFVRLASDLLKGSSVLPITVVSFPAGDASTSQKAAETAQAVEQGAREIDMVLNRHLLRDRNLDALGEDIRAVVQAAGKVPVKVILETSELSDEEKIIASAICVAAGAQFVKTSTGFSKSGAKASDISLMRRVVGHRFGVKASGGIRTLDSACEMIQAGANRLGMSASVAVLESFKQRLAHANA